MKKHCLDSRVNLVINSKNKTGLVTSQRGHQKCEDDLS